MRRKKEKGPTTKTRERAFTEGNNGGGGKSLARRSTKGETLGADGNTREKEKFFYLQQAGEVGFGRKRDRQEGHRGVQDAAGVWISPFHSATSGQDSKRSIEGREYQTA